MNHQSVVSEMREANGSVSSQLTHAAQSVAMEYHDAGSQAYQRLLWRHIRGLLNGVPLGRVLDLGCGNGWISAQIAALGHDVIGMDLSPSGVAVAASAYPHVRFTEGNVYDPISGIFDIVVSSEVIEHLYAPRRFVANIYRHLRPGGIVVLTTPYHGYLKNLMISIVNGWDFHFSVGDEGGHIKFFSPATLSSMLAAAGFQKVRFRYVGRLPLLARSMVVHAVR